MSRQLASMGFVLLLGCVHGQTAPLVDDPMADVTKQGAAVRAAAVKFVEAAERRDFNAAYALLSGALRDRYTPERLASDFEAEPLAFERVARLKAALASQTAFQLLSESTAVLLLGAHKRLTLTREGEAWQVASLE